MSCPTTTILCSNCDYRSSDMVGWGRFVYEGRDGKQLFFNQSLGWCHDCCALTPIEDLNLNIISERIRYNCRRSEQIQEKLFSLRATLASRLGRNKSSISRLESDLNYCQQDTHEQGLLLILLSSRDSPPRCLSCSNISVEPLEIPSSIEGKEPLSIQFRHPGCGGSLMVQKSGIMVNVAGFDEVRVYDEEGRFIRKDFSPLN